MGFSLQSVRAILENPLTMGYYLTQQQHNLRRDIAHAERCVEYIGKMMGKLPLRPDYDDLSRLIDEAGPVAHDPASSDVDFDAALINHVIWAAYIPDGKMTDYQEFLWAKLNRLAVERYAAEYKKIYDYLSAQSPAIIDRIYSAHCKRANEIACFGQAETEAYAIKMIGRLSDFINSPKLTKLWIAKYDVYLQPLVMVSESELAGIIGEISPICKRYMHNINEACQRTYDWLHSEDGKSTAGIIAETTRHEL